MISDMMYAIVDRGTDNFICNHKQYPMLFYDLRSAKGNLARLNHPSQSLEIIHVRLVEQIDGFNLKPESFPK